MDDLRVIEEVQRHGILYDTGHPFYKDNMRKEQAWSDVSLALGADAADIKSRWRMLRDSFVKHVKKISVSNGPPGGALRDWKYASNMSFLQPFIQNRASKRRRLQTPDPEGDRLAPPALLNPSPCPALPAAPSPLPLWAAPLEEDRPPSVTDGDRDEMYHFALSTVPQLLRLGKRHRRRAKMEILQTLSRLEEEEEEQAAARRFLQPAGTETTRTASPNVVAVCTVVALQEKDEQRQRSTSRRFWVHPVNRQRHERGDFHNLVAELQLDRQRHHEYFRMSAEQMEHILSIIGPELTKQSTNFRAAIEPKQRLAVALRYLATGDSLMSLAFSYRLGHSTVVYSVHMVYAAIKTKMTAEFLPSPTEEMWSEVARGFWTKWNFPNCLGAIDGKRVTIQAPAHSGSRKTFTIVLLAVADHEYRFRTVQVGDFGRMIIGSVFSASELGKGLESGDLKVPPCAPLPGAPELGALPHVLVGDAAFPLKNYLLRPYPSMDLNHDKGVFNDRLSRAHAVVECAFGILGARWRILLRDINLHPNHVDALVMSATILHNYLLSPSENQRYIAEAEERGLRLPQAPNIGGNRAARQAYEFRKAFMTYFNSPAGSVS